LEQECAKRNLRKVIELAVGAHAVKSWDMLLILLPLALDPDRKHFSAKDKMHRGANLSGVQRSTNDVGMWASRTLCESVSRNWLIIFHGLAGLVPQKHVSLCAALEFCSFQ